MSQPNPPLFCFLCNEKAGGIARIETMRKRGPVLVVVVDEINLCEECAKELSLVNDETVSF